MIEFLALSNVTKDCMKELSGVSMYSRTTVNQPLWLISVRLDIQAQVISLENLEADRAISEPPANELKFTKWL